LGYDVSEAELSSLFDTYKYGEGTEIGAASFGLQRLIASRGWDSKLEVTAGTDMRITDATTLQERMSRLEAHANNWDILIVEAKGNGRHVIIVDRIDGTNSIVYVRDPLGVSSAGPIYGPDELGSEGQITLEKLAEIWTPGVIMISNIAKKE
jgi:hypothetical protein